jgi:hypothetical protein
MRRVSAMIALLITVSTGIAAAECAWILWQENELSLYGKQGRQEQWWEVRDSYTTREACTQAQLRTWGVLAQQCEGRKCPGVQEVRKVSPSLVTLTFKPDAEGYPSAASQRLLCMTDTIDLREKQAPSPRERRPQFQQ